MGRHSESLVNEHYIYTKTSNKSKCKYCPKEYSGRVITNLRKHLELDHPDILKVVVEAEECAKKRKSGSTTTEPVQKKAAHGSTLDTYFTRKRISIDMDLKMATEACLELVTKNGRPFKIVEDSGLQKLIRPIFSAFGKSMNRKKIAEIVTEEAEKETTVLINQLKTKLVCVKIDLATRHGRSFIGINVQYSHEGKLSLNTLGVVEVKMAHTGQNIKNVFREIMEKFKIIPNQVYSATTDNGSNVVKAMNLCIGEDCTSTESEDESEEQESQASDEIEFETDDWEDNPPGDILTDIDTPNDDSDKAEMDLLTSNIGLLSNVTDYPLRPMRCAAHTLQLGVSDFLKDKAINNLVLSARKLAKKLRTTNMRYVLESAGKRPPPLDVETRWSSTFNMIQCLYNLKTTCEDLCEKNVLTGTYLNAQAWSRIENLLKILKPAKIATDSLQRENLTAGEFHEIWTKLKLSVNALSSLHAKRFSKLIAKREERLLTNPAVLAAMYIDPRYKNILNSVQTLDAQTEILSVARRLIILNDNDIQPVQSEQVVSSIVVLAQNEDDEYENILKAADKTKSIVEGTGIATATLDVKLAALKNELMAYENSPRQADRKIDIFYWWYHRTGASQLLKDVALTVLSVPVTQVSVERLFSGLHYIFNDLKGNMGSDTINDVMLLRTNRDYK